MIDNIRKQSNIVFLDINDGTCLKGIQVILDQGDDDLAARPSNTSLR